MGTNINQNEFDYFSFVKNRKQNDLKIKNLKLKARVLWFLFRQCFIITFQPLGSSATGS